MGWCDADQSGAGVLLLGVAAFDGAADCGGWLYQPFGQWGLNKSSWAAPVDVRRLPPCEDTVAAVTLGQVAAVVARLGRVEAVQLFVFDAGYDPIALTWELAGTRVQLLVRVCGDRVFYYHPRPRPPTPSGVLAGTGTGLPAPTRQRGASLGRRCHDLAREQPPRPGTTSAQGPVGVRVRGPRGRRSGCRTRPRPRCSSGRRASPTVRAARTRPGRCVPRPRSTQ